MLVITMLSLYSLRTLASDISAPSFLYGSIPHALSLLSVLCAFCNRYGLQTMSFTFMYCY